MSDPKSKYWDYKTVEAQLGIKIGTLYSMVSQNQIPHIRLGKRHVMFDAQELIEWLEKHKIQVKS